MLGKIQVSFSKQPYLFFQGNPKFDFFGKCCATKSIETKSIEILPKSAIFKKYRQFFQINHLLSRKSPAVERFQFSWAIILFEAQARRKMPRLPILEKKNLFKNNIYFSEITQKFDCFENPKQYERLTRNLDKKCQIVLLKSFKDFFTITSFFCKETQILIV